MIQTAVGLGGSCASKLLLSKTVDQEAAYKQIDSRQ